MKSKTVFNNNFKLPLMKTAMKKGVISGVVVLLAILSGCEQPVKEQTTQEQPVQQQTTQQQQTQQQAGQEQSSQQQTASKWTCPHCGGEFDAPGKCPTCGMDLTPKQG